MLLAFQFRVDLSEESDLLLKLFLQFVNFVNRAAFFGFEPVDLLVVIVVQLVSHALVLQLGVALQLLLKLSQN